MRTASAIALLVALCLAQPRGAAQDSAPQLTVGAFCSNTAELAQTSCLQDARAAFANDRGRCLNTADAQRRTVCLDRAAQDQAEALQECREQFAARTALCRTFGEAPYDPQVFRASNFVNPLEIGKSIAPNPYFPLVPGSTWVYRSETQVDTVRVVGRVERIAGVPCTVVRDVVTEDGDVVEDTIDWFAQRTNGTVWYCGESALEVSHGRVVGLEGSWRAGDNLARPGIIMFRTPQVGALYRQEFALGDAEDVAKVLSTTGSATVPAASCHGTCVITREFSPIEPGHFEYKYYAPNVGVILEVDPVNDERLQLVRFHIG